MGATGSFFRQYIDILNEAEAVALAQPGVAPAAAPGAAQATQDPNAAAKMQAQQALDRQNQKKELQTAIKQTQDQIVQLQKQLQDQQKQLASIK